MISLQQNWNKFLNEIKDKIASTYTFDMWFKPIVPVSLKNNTLIIRVPSNHFYEYIEGHFLSILGPAIEKVFGKIHLNYQILTDSENNLCTTGRSNKDLPISSNKQKTTGFKTNLDDRMRLDNFYQSQCNKLVYNVAKSIIEKPGDNAFNPLFIYGASGVGKTHIIHAIGNEIIQQFPTKRVSYVPAQIFKLQYVQSTSKKNESADFIHYYQNVDVLLIDDIQELASAPKTQNAFFQIFNNLKRLNKQIIITSDRPPVELKGLEDRLYSRVKCGLTAVIERPDPLLRKQILESKMYEADMTLPDDVFKTIIKYADQNIRDIEGILTSLKAHSVFSGKPIDMDLAHSIISQSISIEKHELTIKAIIEYIVKYFNIEESDIKSKSRKQTIVQARQFAMFLSKEYTDQSLVTIGSEIGGRDHSTVLHAIKSIKNQIETNVVVKNHYTNLIALLNT